MSIYFDFDVGPTGRRFRRAVDGDKSDIKLFCDLNYTEKLFGDVDIGSLIELSPLSICMINENKEVVGFMALGDHPNVTGVDPADWEIWIRNMYQKYYLSRNTLFIHLMCCIDSVTEYFLDEALLSVFQNDTYLLNIILMVPFDCSDESITRYKITFRKRNVHKYCARYDEETDNMSDHFYHFKRQEFCPKLRMRRAVEEDNDDIVEILDTKSPKLKEIYGSYYISELVGRHPESQRRIIVAEQHERAVGVMCLNSEINYGKLQNLYELRPFYGLKKATPLEKEQNKRSNVLLNTFGKPIMNGELSPFDHLDDMQVPNLDVDDTSKENITGPRAKKLSKVNFSRNAAMRRSMDLIKHYHSDDSSQRSLTLSQVTNYSVADLLDEDPFDYDIINIDSSLLAVPEALSCHRLTTKSKDFPGQSLSVVRRSKPKKRNSLFTLNKSEEEETIYHGGPNAFMIELYGLRHDIDDRYAFDLLEAAFEIMKDYDYCIIRVPAADKSFPLLQHFCFVPKRPNVCSRYALYVAHRCSVLGRLRVRDVEMIDIPQIANLLQHLDGNETIWSIENSILKNKKYQAYVFFSGLSLVGLGILESPEQMDFIRAKFNLEWFHNHKYHVKGQGMNTGIAALKVVLVYPAFEAHYRFFGREMMRLSGSTTLLWLTAYRNKWMAHKANSMASAMVPLLPRSSEIDCTSVPELKKINSLAKSVMAFSTWYLGKKITSVPMVNVTTQLVIIGASRTSMAFLNTLLFRVQSLKEKALDRMYLLKSAELDDPLTQGWTTAAVELLVTNDASSYLTFTNVTLISPDGLPYVRQSKAAAESMFPQHRTSSDKYLKSVPYTYYVNVVHGNMVEINKQEKSVTISNGNKYNYDLLFLLFGKQYQHPDYLKPLMERERERKFGNIPPYVRLDVPTRNGVDVQAMQYSAEDTPDNVFIINNRTEANKALTYVKNLSWHGADNYKVLVYGAKIHAYCCVNTLLEINIPPENIVFIEPFPPEDPYKTRVPVFCNVNVDQTVLEVLDNLKITVHRSYYFQSWSVDFDNLVTHVEFLSQFQFLRLECSAFFYYGKQGINTEAFIALNKSGIAYDGGILIDHKFTTKDPSIYSAGPATIYHRRYFAQTSRHKFYDSYEIGEKLGEQIRNQLDPLFSGRKYIPGRNPVGLSTKNVSFDATFNEPMSSGDNDGSMNRKISSLSRDSVTSLEKLPEFVMPIVTYCILPGNLQYLDVRSPGLKFPHHYVQSLNFNGYVMETFKCGYFKLHFNNDMVIDAITCLSPEKYSLENFTRIYGLSAVTLNNVHLRYAANKLDDFYEYFRSPWAFFLYYDQSDELFATVKELLPKGQRNGETIREALRFVGVKLSATSKLNAKVKIRTNFESSPHIEAITDYVIEWVSDNDVLLPMYLKPSQQSEYSHDLEKNPAFRKRKTTITKMISMIF